jgi:tRNA A37 methylthiotransferase MiaB
VRAERLTRLAQLEAELRGEYFQSLVGRRLRVLVESIHLPTAASSEATAQVAGWSCRYAPVRLPGTLSDDGRLIDVRAQRLDGDELIATLTPQRR